VVQDVALGFEQRRYTVRPDQLHGAVGVIAGATLSAVLLVLEGMRTWRDAGTDAAELVLRGLGVEPSEARRLATAELPLLAELP
jgi:hypothetical protein